MILLKHGVFSFAGTAKESYKRMISIVNKAEGALPRKINLDFSNSKTKTKNETSSFFTRSYYLLFLPSSRRCERRNKQWREYIITRH